MLAMMNEELSRRLILAGLLGAFAVLAAAVLYRFVIPVAWAAILAYVTWPAYARLCRAFGGQRTLGALVMTLLLTAVFVLPIMGLFGLLRSELPMLFRTLTERLASGPIPVPDVVRSLPYIGTWIDGLIRELAQDPAILQERLRGLIQGSGDEIALVIGGVGRNLAKFGFAVLTLFFLYRDGERVFSQLRQVLERFIGPSVEGYLAAVGGTTRAVVYGLVLTAVAQGVLAGIGYWGAGITAPVLLGAVTAIIALIPFGTPFVWGAAGLWLLVTGQTWQGIGLLLWGTLVVSWVDNLIRPIVISQATRIPFLIVMFGVLGGVTAFGLIGLFVGPVVLAVMMAVWREWLEESTARKAAGAMPAHATPRDGSGT